MIWVQPRFYDWESSLLARWSLKRFLLVFSVTLETDNRHQVVPPEVHKEAEDYAKRSLEESGDLDEEIGML